MDFSKIIAVISAFVLIVCLVLSMITLVVLRNAVAENGQLQAEAKSLLNDLNTTADKFEDHLVLKQEEPTEIPVDADAEIFVLREFEGKLGVYDESGVMLHWVELDLALLPQSERQALSEGITVEGRMALLSYLLDYGE